MTPKTVVIHIGTAKTGTTSIQRSLAGAEANGSLGPVSYPLWGNDYNQQRMALIYPPGEMWSAWLQQFQPAKDRSLQRMRKRYREFLFSKLRSSEAAIISAEMLNSIAPQHIAELRSDLKDLGFRAFHIILYVRDPADFYLSNTAQSLRSSATPPLISDPAVFKYDFMRAAERWERVFPDRLVVRLLPRDPHYDVVRDFATLAEQRLGIEFQGSPVRMNPMISAEAMHILDEYRSTCWPDNGGLITPDVFRLIKFLGEQDIPQTTPVLEPGVAAVIRGNHRADADLLHARYGVDLELHDSRTALTPRAEPYRVAEILESLNPDITRNLLLRLAWSELKRYPAQRPLPLRLAAEAYRRIPPGRRPRGIETTLRKFLSS